MAGYLRDEHVEPALVLCSSAVRARQTLEGVAPALGGHVEVLVEDGLYGAWGTDLAARLRAVPDDVASAMLIGHQPAIQELALMLAGGGERIDALQDKFPTGALAVLAFSGGWSALAPGVAELTAFVRPRELER